ncbi:MAG: type I methionyl aminopeptidase [Candidatus Pacebacteria bacterium]|nr:type I methionyl aminopeptidase [Candidatus Paceibacterota bacterium]
MTTQKTPEEIKILEEGGKILAAVLNEVASKAVPGISAKELDEFAYKLIEKFGGKPSFLKYKPRGCRSAYPASLCVSVNEEVVHGIPTAEKILKDGDIAGLDLGLEYKGLFTDMALTVGVGKISEEAEKIINTAKEALFRGIDVLKEGARLGDYGFVVKDFAKKNGFSVVENLVGHGVGYAVHEDPDIPNWGEKKRGLMIKSGMVLALEPMLCLGSPEVVLAKDEWTWKTKDGLISSHFEHTVAVDKDGVKILTQV